MTPDSFRSGAEEIGMVVTHPALVYQAGQSSSAWKYAKQWQLGKRYRGGAVVYQQYVLARQLCVRLLATLLLYAHACV